ncbi:MAG: tRNA guanosine(15) transglycosylase TgtA, partial [Candidatus Lokiarchaeota archaeon]|nr:tRNA guanosine(15) transglycosylase TgtA [Candidatus Lokiarchaeota archaeon]
MEYELLDSDLLGRVGRLEYKDYKIVTPNLIPVIHPFDNIIEPSKIKDIGFNCIFTNAYIIYQNINKRQEILNKGLKNYLDFDGLIATDSGAFQQYMYHKEDIKITAQEIENFQEDIGSDFPVILDVPVQPDDEYIQAKEKIEKSLIRAQSNIKNRRREECWIGPIHGAKYSDLLRKSTKKMSELDFGIYAIGGLVKFFLDYRFKQILNILLTVKKNIIPDKPLHMFGLGLPQFFSLAVACGCDLMDSAAYILYAKENRYFTLTTGTKRLDELKEFPCNCPICSKYKPIELKKFNQNKRIRLLALHNLYISQQELKTIRQAIYEGNLWELIEERVRAHPNLSDCLNIIRKNASFFEEFEKIYKDHGRLFSSFESIYRPILIRYKQRLKNRYRVPEGVKYLIILPELDIKGKNSPSINTWLNKINTNKIISRDLIHV